MKQLTMLGVLVLSAAGCGSRGSSPILATSPDVPLRIENRSKCDVRVLVYEAGALRAHYAVPALSDANVRFAPLQRLDRLRFVADPAHDCGRAYELGTLVQTPQRIAVTIGAQPGESTVSPVDAPRVP